MTAHTASSLQPAAAPVPARPSDPSRLDRGGRRTAAVLLLVFVAAVAFIVFWPGPPDPSGQSSLKHYLAEGPRHGLPSWITFSFVETLANVLMFVPLGLLGSLSLRAHHYLAVLYAAVASGIIELLQLLLLPDRVASVDDIKANTIGALVGFLFSIPALRARARRRRRYRVGRVAAGDSPRRRLLTAQR